LNPYRPSRHKFSAFDDAASTLACAERGRGGRVYGRRSLLFRPVRSVPYGKLALTQLPGARAKVGRVDFPVFVRIPHAKERQELHVNALAELIDRRFRRMSSASVVGRPDYLEHLRDQWFSEGLANYCALMILQEKNPAGFRQIMENIGKIC